MGTRRSRLEVPTTPEAVALGHLATHVDDLAIPGELPEDSANSKGRKLLNSCLSGGIGWRGFGHEASINADSEGKQGIRLRNPQPPPERARPRSRGASGPFASTNGHEAVVYGAGVRFELDWRDRNVGSTRKTPRRFLDFIVDSQSLYERHGSDYISPLGWLRGDHDERAAQRLLRKEAPDIEGRVAIYVCPECADLDDLDCGALTTLVTREGDDIVWREVAFSYPFYGTWRHDPITGWEELRFPAGDYWRAITERPRATTP